MAMLKVAICYDFDGTLAPGNMQEHDFIPDLDMSKDEFWREVKLYQRYHQCDQILAYMHLMLQKSKDKGIVLSRQQFMEYGSKLSMFQGVNEWFDALNKKARRFYNIEIEHYIMSAGLTPMIDGTPIRKEIKQIFASEFLYDNEGNPYWPAYSVNFTSKTQFLFRIEKGIFREEDIDGLNDASSKNHEYIPFDRMIYIGDGMTDVPCMKLVKDRGGYSIAVYDLRVLDGKSHRAAKKLLKDKRVHFIAPTDYTEEKELWQYIDYILNKISIEREMRAKQRSCNRKKESDPK